MQLPKYTLGLDIGIGSVGAALLGESGIVGMHVRAFDAAENSKDGSSINLQRREARSARRRLRRKAFRLVRLRRLFKKVGLTETNKIDEIAGSTCAWQLRSEGLERLLSNREWARVLYHLVNHRGFQSNRKSEASDAEAGKMLTCIKGNQLLMQEKGYKTVGQMVWQDESFKDAKRNKGRDYKRTFDRSDIQHELECLFQQQAALGNTHASEAFLDDVVKLLLARRPTVTGDDILKMVGKCTFEPDELRAAKHTYSAERFVWLGKLNNLRLLYPGEQRPLSQDERNLLINLPYELSSLKFGQIRKKLGLPDFVRFNLVRYGSDADFVQAEKQVFFEARAYHTLRKAYEQNGLQREWSDDKHNAERLDTIATAIALYRDDALIRPQLAEQGIQEAVIEAVLECSFDQFINLSLTVLRKILPHMEQGMRYDEALEQEGYKHYAPKEAVKSGRIPAPDKSVIRNPVVYRSLNQARKVINAIVERYGPPMAIHLELGRDLSRPMKERQAIEKEQDKFRKEKEQMVALFLEHFGREPSGLDLLKYRLYREQDCKCAYTGGCIDLNRLSEPGYVEVDHILPYSRSFDDSLLNKALVLTAENRNKGNRTPFEYMGSDEDSEQWRLFVARVQSNPKIRLAKRNRYLRKNFGQDAAKEFKARHLNDTRYIGRELKAMIEEHIIWDTDSPSSDRCVIISGRLTSLMRHRWGFDKVRANGDLHHAVDAAVVAATSRSMIQRMARHAQFHELKTVTHSYADPMTGEVLDLTAARNVERDFPLPWDTFKQDVLAYLAPAPVTADPSEQRDHQGVRVSRPVRRRNTGAVHEETIRSVGKGGELLQADLSAVKTPLDKLTLKNLPDVVGYDDPRNQGLIEVLRERLEAFGGDGKKAFAHNQPPVFKPARDGRQAAPIRSVKLLSTQKSGTEVRDGIANNGSMIRVDVFSKGGRYFLVPLYVGDIAKDKLPNRAIAAGKKDNQWPEVDETYDFLFSLYPNDWVKVIMKGKVVEGYYGGADRSTGLLNIWVHDRDQRTGKNGLIRGVGVKTAILLEKHHIDILGKRHAAKPEKRKALRNGQEV